VVDSVQIQVDDRRPEIQMVAGPDGFVRLTFPTFADDVRARVTIGGTELPTGGPVLISAGEQLVIELRPAPKT